ncbi:MAG: acyltransferase family protein [Methyloligellaceae bacterium]
MRHTTSNQASEDKTYLYEIQGLRTVAALLVAIYHIWFQKVSGGVDVFFVVAAYFMTLSLLKWGDLSINHINQFYLSTLKRVLPGASVVIFCSIILAIIFLQVPTWRSELHHALGSLLFKENWRLAEKGTNYLTQGLSASIFQQMWALSVQMQLYLIFPLLIAFACFIAKLRDINVKTVTLLLFISVFAGSFLYSIYITDKYQKWAYFDTFARVWEFCIGAILALIAGYIKLSKTTAWVLGTLALLVLVFFPLLLDETARFPGYIALIPTLAASAIIISAKNKGNIYLLNNPLFVGLGKISFSFYLWHWPLLIIAKQSNSQGNIDLLTGTIIILIAGVLAFLTTEYIETPFRNKKQQTEKPARAYAYCLAVLIPGIIALLGWQGLYRYTISSELARLEHFIQNTDMSAVKVRGLIPSPKIASQDRPDETCKQRMHKVKVITCQHGNPDHDKVVAIVGSSHAHQWYSVLKEIADQNDFRIVMLTKSACNFALGNTNRTRHSTCATWNKIVLKRVIAMKPALVFTTSTRPDWGKGDYVPDGYISIWKKLAKHNIPVFAIRDNPWFRKDIPECLERNPDNFHTCGSPRAKVLSDIDPTHHIKLPSVYFSDFSNYLCTKTYCPAVYNGLTIYRDKHHLTKTFTFFLKKPLHEELKKAISQFKELKAKKISSRASKSP